MLERDLKEIKVDVRNLQGNIRDVTGTINTHVLILILLTFVIFRKDSLLFALLVFSMLVFIWTRESDVSGFLRAWVQRSSSADQKFVIITCQ
jgi:hypothetical protein